MNCFKHKCGLPCDQCNQETYDRCLQENNQNLGAKDYIPHDLTELKKNLKIPFEQKMGINQYTEYPDDSLAYQVKLKEHFRYGSLWTRLLIKLKLKLRL